MEFQGKEETLLTELRITRTEIVRADINVVQISGCNMKVSYDRPPVNRIVRTSLNYHHIIAVMNWPFKSLG